MTSGMWFEDQQERALGVNSQKAGVQSTLGWTRVVRPALSLLRMPCTTRKAELQLSAGGLCWQYKTALQHSDKWRVTLSGHTSLNQPILVLVAHALQQATSRVTKAEHGGAEAHSSTGGPVSRYLNVVTAKQHIGWHDAPTALCGRRRHQCLPGSSERGPSWGHVPAGRCCECPLMCQYECQGSVEWLGQGGCRCTLSCRSAQGWCACSEGRTAGCQRLHSWH